MTQFRKRPVVIDAWQWLYDRAPRDGSNPPPDWVVDALCHWPAMGSINFEPDHPEGARISIATLEGVMLARPGDWIIRGVKRELYSCKPDIFAATYEAA